MAETVRNLPENAGDLGSISGLGLGRSPGGGHGNPHQYSCLENPHGIFWGSPGDSASKESACSLKKYQHFTNICTFC